MEPCPLQEMEATPAVLAVDDEPYILDMIEDQLEDEFQVRTFTSPRAALEALKKGDFAVLITDQRMPEMRGEELLKQAAGVSRAIRVLVTGYTDVRSLIQAVNDSGIFAYVRKPWDPQSFLATIRQAVRQHELALELSKESELLRGLLEHSPDKIYFKDLEGRFVRVNPRFAREEGYPQPESLHGLTHLDLGSPGADRAHRQDLATLAQGRPRLDRLEKMLLPDGSTRYWSVSKIPVPEVGLIAFSRDVTDRRRITAERDAFFEDTLELLAIASFEGVFCQLNPAWERTLGWSVPELCERPLLERVHPEDRPATAREIEALTADGEPLSAAFESRCLCKSGGFRWLAWTCRADREHRRLYATARDVTEARLAERRLLARAEQDRCLAQLGELAFRELEPQAFWSAALCAVRRVLAVACCGLFSIDGEFRAIAEDTPGIALGAALPARSMLDLTVRWNQPVLSQDLAREARFELDHPALKNVRSAASFPIARAGGLWGVLQILCRHPRTFAEDTSFLAAVSHLFSLALHDEVVKKELEESRLHFLHAQKMEAVGRLAGGIAHDFNNLLTVIKGNAQILVEDLESMESRSDALSILKAVEKATALTGWLLSFSRQQKAEPRSLDLREALQEDQHLLRRTLSTEIQLEFDLGSRPVWVFMDPAQLTQILLNLVVNARDALPSRGGRIDVRLRSRVVPGPSDLAPGEYALLEVEDNGSGIPLELQAKVFEPFFTTKKREHGTGLGLSTCYGLVQAASGSIQLESDTGRGSTFRIFLPESAAPSEPGGMPAAEAPVAAGESDTLLLVDDDPQVLSLLARGLARLGYRVRTAASGDEAVQAAGEEGPSLGLIVCDVLMTGETGPEIVARLMPLCPGAPVLYISGYSGDYLASLPAGGSVELMNKPFDMHALARKARQLLDRARSRKS